MLFTIQCTILFIKWFSLCLSSGLWQLLVYQPQTYPILYHQPTLRPHHNHLLVYKHFVDVLGIYLYVHISIGNTTIMYLDGRISSIPTRGFGWLVIYIKDARVHTTRKQTKYCAHAIRVYTDSVLLNNTIPICRYYIECIVKHKHTYTPGCEYPV